VTGARGTKSRLPAAQRAGQAAFTTGAAAALYTASGFGALLFLHFEPAEACLIAAGVGVLVAAIAGRMVQSNEWRVRKNRLEEIRRLAPEPELEPEESIPGSAPREERESREIQRALLPRSVPELEDYHVEVDYLPSGTLGGDFYDFHLCDDGRLLVTLGDVSGKGPAGAIVMAMVQTLFRQNAPLASDPSDLLVRVNDGFAGALGKGVFVTALAGLLDPATHSLTLAGAGHPPVLLLNPERRRSTIVRARGTALGLVRGPRFSESLVQTTIDLDEGDALLFYTDGVIESREELEKGTGDHRFRAAAAASILNGPKGALHRLREDLWPDGERLDDATLVLLSRMPSGTGKRQRSNVTPKRARA
jgi:serine phosphatase RsbU (regulator of sigma subunit)